MDVKHTHADIPTQNQSIIHRYNETEIEKLYKGNIHFIDNDRGVGILKINHYLLSYLYHFAMT